MLMKNFQFSILILALILIAAPEHLLGQTDGVPDEAPETSAATVPDSNCTELEPEGQDSGTASAAGCEETKSLSNYKETISIDENQGKSVEADLVNADTFKPAIFPIDVVHDRLGGIYRLKARIHDRIGLAFSVDYAMMAQRVSYTEGETNTGSSSVFRILGTWLRVGHAEKAQGVLIWKTETRNPIWGNPTPRDLGFTTGSALSTANFKSLEWGITDLYWRQTFNSQQQAFQIGHMDPGDWADQYPLLNAWTSFTNDAFYNNPTEAIPKRGFGIAGQTFVKKDFYLAGGVHDANGGDGDLDFQSFWATREWFSWVEMGYRSNPTMVARHNAHVHYWHQDARQEAGTKESRGLAFTYSYVTRKDRVAFVRAGYSRGDAPQMRRFIGIGMSYKPWGRDTLGVATSWGSAPDKSLRDQVTSEIFYRVQVTQNLTFTPSIQLTYNPSYTLETRWLTVPGIRMRFVF